MFLIRNIKVSVKVEALILNNALSSLKNNQVLSKEFGNFITFKHNNYTFVLFKTGKNKESHINITQISNFDSINKAIDCLIKLINCTVNSYSIDNIIATSDLNKSISLSTIIKNKRFERIKYNNEIFPGLFIKFNQGTVIIFHSGKIVLVGCKSIENIEWLMSTIYANI